MFKSCSREDLHNHLIENCKPLSLQVSVPLPCIFSSTSITVLWPTLLFGCFFNFLSLATGMEASRGQDGDWLYTDVLLAPGVPDTEAIHWVLVDQWINHQQPHFRIIRRWDKQAWSCGPHASWNNFYNFDSNNRKHLNSPIWGHFSSLGHQNKNLHLQRTDKSWRWVFPEIDHWCVQEKVQRDCKII